MKKSKYMISISSKIKIYVFFVLICLFNKSCKFLIKINGRKLKKKQYCMFKKSCSILHEIKNLEKNATTKQLEGPLIFFLASLTM